jgi:chorismate mutase/prephenate dehydrogenase
MPKPKGRSNRAGPRNAARRRRALVVGGNGRMGRLFARWLNGRRFHVLVADPAGAPAGCGKGRLDDAADADVVVVAASLSRAPEALSGVVARSPKGLVFDIASVKTPLAGVLEDAVRRGLAVASVHPMFGPDVASFRGHDLIVCDCGNAAAARRARALFAGSGVRVATMPLAEHDPWVARTMGLTHALALGVAAALAVLEVDVRKLDGRASTSFRRLVELVEPILDQEAELTRTIQTGNPHSEEALLQFEREMTAVRKLLLHEPPERLDAVLVGLRRALRRRR